MSGLTKLRTYGSRQDAELARGLLEAAGIAAVVAADDFGSLGPALTFVRGAHLCVAADDAERANAVLSAAEAAE